MYKLIVLLFILVLFSCGQNSTKDSESKEINLPEGKTSIEFKEKMHNFGKLTAGEIVAFTFEFTNTGTNSYAIKSIHSDCGCVTANFKKIPVKPGETGIIEVEFDTAGLVGKEFKTIEIKGNSKELKHLAIFAEVKNKFIDIKY